MSDGRTKKKLDFLALLYVHGFAKWASRLYENSSRLDASKCPVWSTEVSLLRQPYPVYHLSMDKTSLSLLARLRRSPESESWNRLVELYAPLMRGWLRSYEVTGADADDLVQDVLIVVSQELPNFKHNEQPGAFRSWLRKVLVNRLRNYWRARQLRPTAKGGSSLVEQLDQLEDETSKLSRIWNEQHDREVIAKLMELVRPKFQAKTWEAFHRQMLGGQRPDQVAAELSMPLGSVYMARHRVLNALRREAAGLVDSL